MKRLLTFRFTLALLCTLGLLAGGGLAYFYGATLNGVQIGLLTLILSKLTSSMGGAYSWFYDGAAPKPEDNPPPASPAPPPAPEPQPAAGPYPLAPPIGNIPAPPAPPVLSADSTTPATIGDVSIHLQQAPYDVLKNAGWTDEQIIAAGMSPPIPPTEPKGP